MTLARSDNKVIASAIEAMKDLVLARGGFVHPAAAIEEQDGMMRVVCHEPFETGTSLFRVPHGLLVPTNDLIWSDSSESMVLTGLPADYGTDRKEMLDLFVTIYNASDKMPWFRKQAAHVLLHDTELAGHLALIDRENYAAAPTPSAAFIQTRHYESSHLEGEKSGMLCIMPLIDFLNHHVEGAPYRHESGCLVSDIALARGSRECFANYGKYRDSLSLALNHGYLDLECTMTQSVGAILDFPGFGCVEIKGKRIASRHRADLPKVEFTNEGLTLSHFAGDTRTPHHLQGTLRLVMTASGKRRGIPQAATERAIAEFPDALLAENQRKLSVLRGYLATREDLPLARLISDACTRQFALLEQVLKA